jgi:hypothetical protein
MERREAEMGTRISVALLINWPYEGHKDLDLVNAIRGAFASLERAGARGSFAISAAHYPGLPGFDANEIAIQCSASRPERQYSDLAAIITIGRSGYDPRVYLSTSLK